MAKTFLKHSQEEVIDFVQTFFHSFDEKDWELMNNCLNEKLELDYESFRGTPSYTSSSKEYIEKRRIGLEKLNTEHTTSNHILSRHGGKIKCNCNFIIKRFELGSKEYFHSYGKYEIWLMNNEGNLKIYKIKQELEKNEGNRNIHGAFKTIKK